MEMAAPKNTTPKEIAIRFLECIKLRDQDQMRAMYLPGATACLIRDGKPMYLLMDDILDKMNAASVSGLESEEVSYDEIEHVDGDFATVWTPFKFYENGKVSAATQPPPMGLDGEISIDCLSKAKVCAEDDTRYRSRY